MKIENSSAQFAVPLDGTHKKAAVESPEKGKTAAKVEDAAYVVEFSKTAQKMAAPSQDEEEIRRAKVAAIRDQLASGSYNISGKDVANKILGALKG